jgi:formate dehydrogenase maturation protein FdhE
VTEIKNKVTDMMKPILKSATSEQYDSMIKDVRNLRKQRRQEKKNQKSAAAPGLQPDGPTAPPLQEQGESLWASQVMPFLASIPTGVWIIIGAWIILRLLRCKIYEFEFSVMRCANGGQRNIIVKLTELLMLDFRNFFEFDDNLWNCGED